MQRRRALQLIATSALSISATRLFIACSEQKSNFNAVDITGADYAKDFELTDHNGQLRHLKDFAGKVVVIFFGYTQCPDVCPTSMAELAAIKKELGANGNKLQGLFVTIDPERDTPLVLKAYMTNFDPTFLALRAPPDKLAALARDYKIFYKKVEGKTPTSYSMDHSAGSFVYDAKSQLRLYARYGGPIAPLTADIAALIQQTG